MDGVFGVGIWGVAMRRGSWKYKIHR
jgi:hypothetical protein